jgi:hypothetical protein
MQCTCNNSNSSEAEKTYKNLQNLGDFVIIFNIQQQLEYRKTTTENKNEKGFGVCFFRFLFYILYSSRVYSCNHLVNLCQTVFITFLRNKNNNKNTARRTQKKETYENTSSSPPLYYLGKSHVVSPEIGLK